MQQSNPETYPDHTDEIDLRKLINSLVAKKLFIFGLTGFVTLLAIIYTLNLTPIYKATSLVIKPSNSSITKLNSLNYISTTKESTFSDFLTSLKSQAVQKKVFLDGGYLTALNTKKEQIDDIDGLILGFIQSITISPPNLNIVEHERVINLSELSYLVSMVGSNPEVISRYINDLIVFTNTQVIKEFSMLSQLRTNIRLDEIPVERELLLTKAKRDRLNQIERIKEEDSQKIREINDQIDRARFKAKENRLNEIVALTDDAILAKSLGIIDNNFKLINDDEFNSNLTIAIGNKDLPVWYLYGEKALLERIELLKTRKIDGPFIPEIVTLKNQLNEVQNNNLLETLEERLDDSPFIDRINELDIEKIKLESNIIDLTGINSMQLSRSAYTKTIEQNKRLIVLLALIGSFMMSIFLALVMGALKPDEERST